MKILCSIIFYWSYASLIFLGYLFYSIYLYWIENSKIYILYAFLTLLFIYSRFVEPYIIKIKKTKIDVWFKANIVVLADLHLWVYKNESFLNKIVQKVNEFNNIDLVFIPWDSIFLVSSKNDLDKLFFPLSKIKIPVFITFWSHDFESKGVKKEDLIDVFKKYNIKLLDNQSIKIDNLNVEILWLWDNHIWYDKIELINNYSKNENLIVVAHNPDTILSYKNNDIPRITITWHTHWGQIRLPFIYKYVIPCKWNFDAGFYDYNNNKLFVSSGLWEVLLPMRLFIPPVIDILVLS